MSYTAFVKKNIRRTPYQALAASMVMFVTFLVLTVFLILASGFQQILKFYESKPQAIAFFKDGTSDTDVKTIQSSLEQSGKATKFNYVSKEEALQIYRDRNKNNPMLLELVTANILPASLEISTLTPDDLKPIAEVLKKEPVVEDVVFPEDVVASLTQATRLIRIAGGGIVGFLIIFSILIIVMIIGFKIRIKRQEIEIMKLMGAHTWFIRIPYILEGIFYSTTGAFLGWLSGMGLLWYFEPLLKQNLGEVATEVFPIHFTWVVTILLIEFIVSVLLGYIGSFVAVRRYLHI